MQSQTCWTLCFFYIKLIRYVWNYGYKIGWELMLNDIILSQTDIVCKISMQRCLQVLSNNSALVTQNWWWWNHSIISN